MKILALIGSLRKQNTYDTVKKIETYHKQYTNCEYEYLFLKDTDLKLCTGCHICITQGEDLCPLKDDRDAIIKKIEESDGVILACPTFSMNVPWLMKNYMDRLSYIMHRPQFFKQRFMLLIVSGSYMGGKSALKSLSFAAFAGKVINKLIVLNSPGMNENKRNKQDQKIKKAAINFAKNMDNEYSPKPSFAYLIWFSAFKAISIIYKDESVADYNFYKERKYFIDIHLTVIDDILIRIFTGFFTYLLKKGFI